MGARVYYSARYGASGLGAAMGRASCERCGGRARYAGYGWGYICAGCRGLLAATNRAAVVELAGGYGIETNELVEQLANEFGLIKTRAPSAPPALLRYDEVPGDAAAYVAGLGAGAHGLQLALVSRVLWGLALWDGCNLSGYPRDHYPADTVEWGLVRWAYDSPMARRWLTVYGFALRARWAERHGRDHSAAELIVWLVSNAMPSLFRRYDEFKQPPSFKPCGGEE